MLILSLLARHLKHPLVQLVDLLGEPLPLLLEFQLHTGELVLELLVFIL